MSRPLVLLQITLLLCTLCASAHSDTITIGVISQTTSIQQVEAGALAERTQDLALTLSQAVYSDSQFSAFTQEKYLQDGRLAAYDAARLDSVQDATISYLDAMRSETQLRIQQDNLSLTRANLDLARDRVKIGSASNADIFRWESNLASAQASVVAAIASKEQTREQLNRILNRPLRAPFQLLPAKLQDPFTMTEQEFNDLVNNARRYERFAQFNVEYGLSLAPEIAQLNAQLAAVERDVVSRKRSYWLPDFSVNAQYTDDLDTQGLNYLVPAQGRRVKI